MIKRALGLSLGIGALGASGKAGYDYLNSNQFNKTVQPDMSSLGSSSFFYGAVKGAFDGNNLIANLGLDIGSRAYASHLEKRAFSNLVNAKPMSALGYQYSGGTFGSWNSPTRSHTSSGATQWLKTKTAVRGEAARRVGQAVDTLSNDDYKSVMKREVKRLRGGITNQAYRAARSISGDGGVAASSLRSIRTAGKIRSFGRMVAWAPLAFMAFDMVSSLGNMPAPTTDARPRKGAGLSGTFIDTSMAYTQRKRALQAMHNSQYGGRSALGNEAALLHR